MKFQANTFWHHQCTTIIFRNANVGQMDNVAYCDDAFVCRRPFRQQLTSPIPRPGSPLHTKQHECEDDLSKRRLRMLLQDRLFDLRMDSLCGCRVFQYSSQCKNIPQAIKSPEYRNQTTYSRRLYWLQGSHRTSGITNTLYIKFNNFVYIIINTSCDEIWSSLIRLSVHN